VRAREDVRPIFWNNRPKSYVARTASWDEFPNGRWGDSRSPAFGELSNYHLNALYGQWDAGVDRRALWGVPAREQDVWATFGRYVKGEVARLPWSDTPLAAETDRIRSELLRLNQGGFLTINSQPRVNAAPSDDSVHGWGGPHGYVFQKAYLEFFTSPRLLQRLLARIREQPQLGFMAINGRGESFANFSGTCAVTWGVFPGREVLQPTVVDSNSFLVWKDEAFGLWRAQWLQLYNVDQQQQPTENKATPEALTQAHRVLEEMIDNYFLVSLVDNNFVSGDIFAPFYDVLRAESEGLPLPAPAFEVMPARGRSPSPQPSK
jgi:methylenetetrahydrofolate reductase (NADPH)